MDSLEELAEREPPGLRRQIAFAKAAAATELQAYERGWQLAGKISDETLRVQMTNWLAYRAALHFIDEGDLTRAYTVNRKNEDAAQRTVCLIAGAQKLSAGRDELRAREWLREASAQMRSASLDESWPKIALGIVATYGKFDPVAALSSLEDAVRVMNKSPAASVRSDGAPPLDRFTGIVSSDLTYSTHGFSLDTAIAGFPGKDFESVFGVLSNVHAPEARGLAIVTLCQRFLKSSAGPETTREPSAKTVSISRPQ